MLNFTLLNWCFTNEWLGSTKETSNKTTTGCSLNIVFFANSPSPALGSYWSYQKWSANRSDCTLVLRWKALKVFYSDVREEGVAVNCEKTQFFLNTLYMLSPLFKVPVCTCENLKNEKSFLIYHCIGCPCTLSTRRLGFSIYFAFSNQYQRQVQKIL